MKQTILGKKYFEQIQDSNKLTCFSCENLFSNIKVYLNFSSNMAVLQPENLLRVQINKCKWKSCKVWLDLIDLMRCKLQMHFFVFQKIKKFPGFRCALFASEVSKQTQ